MTGLDAERDVIVEIATLVTDDELEHRRPRAPTSSCTRTPRRWRPWTPSCATCTPSPACCRSSSASTISLEEAGAQTLAFIKEHVPDPRTVPLCGNSIGTDRRFLVRVPARDRGLAPLPLRRRVHHQGAGPALVPRRARRAPRRRRAATGPSTTSGPRWTSCATTASTSSGPLAVQDRRVPVIPLTAAPVRVVRCQGPRGATRAAPTTGDLVGHATPATTLMGSKPAAGHARALASCACRSAAASTIRAWHLGTQPSAGHPDVHRRAGYHRPPTASRTSPSSPKSEGSHPKAVGITRRPFCFLRSPTRLDPRTTPQTGGTAMYAAAIIEELEPDSPGTGLSFRPPRPGGPTPAATTAPAR